MRGHANRARSALGGRLNPSTPPPACNAIPPAPGPSPRVTEGLGAVDARGLELVKRFGLLAKERVTGSSVCCCELTTSCVPEPTDTSNLRRVSNQ